MFLKQSAVRFIPWWPIAKCSKGNRKLAPNKLHSQLLPRFRLMWRMAEVGRMKSILRMRPKMNSTVHWPHSMRRLPVQPNKCLLVGYHQWWCSFEMLISASHRGYRPEASACGSNRSRIGCNQESARRVQLSLDLRDTTTW